MLRSRFVRECGDGVRFPPPLVSILDPAMTRGSSSADHRLAAVAAARNLARRDRRRACGVAVYEYYL